MSAARKSSALRPGMKTGDAGVALIKSFEGFVPLAYDDLAPKRKLTPGMRPFGTLTIGYGHTGRDVVIGRRITPAEGEALLRADLATAEAAVTHRVSVPLNQNQFDALVSFVFNCGETNFARSTLLRLVNAGQFERAAREFAKWNKSGGKVLTGLIRRRSAEAALFAKA